MKPWTNIPNQGLWNVFVTGLTVLVFLSLVFFQNQVRGDECTMAVQLRDPYVRTNYDLVVESGRMHDTGGLCGAVILPNPGNPGENNTVFDQISMECINCHDGTVARAVDFRFEKNESQGITSLVTLTASHPIGVDYAKLSGGNTFNHWRSLPAEIVLMNGRIGCASCHNLLGSNAHYLAVTMEGSTLCFTCHRK